MRSVRSVFVRLLKWTIILLIVGFLVDLLAFYGCGFAINPLNEQFFEKFAPPADFSVPEVIVPLRRNVFDYEFTYKHRYRGQHQVILNIVGESDGDEIEFVNGGLAFQGAVLFQDEMEAMIEGVLKKIIYTRDNTLPGKPTTPVPLCRYEDVGFWGRRYKVRLRFGDELSTLLEKHPRSYVCVKNSVNL